jgi:DNA-binding transcriptional LysR family regulator
MDRLDAMGVFAKVVEAGSLSAAARALGVSLASVSRHLAALEDQLGARLISRTTRRLSLTEGGRAYYERCKRILGDVEEAEAAVSQFQATPSGRVVVSASVLFGRTFLAPALPDFLERYPRVAVELTLTDRFVNLVEEGVDVAVRVGGLADSSLVARRIGGFRRVVCAAPAYLKRRGVPKEPADMTGHDCLIYSMLAEVDRWRFIIEEREVAIPVTGRLRSNNQDVLLRAALDSAGIMLAPSWLVRDHVASGRLRLVLEDFEPESTPIHILYPHARLLSAKVRALIDYLAARWREEDFGFGRSAAAAQFTAARRGSTGGRRRRTRSPP